MRKTRLSLDSLDVESFETARVPQVGGTVHAHGPTGFTSYCQCQQVTVYGTCQGTCVNTCGGPTCDEPCQSANTCYLTCIDRCGWTYGDVTCIEA
jgi:hypothetical protein